MREEKKSNEFLKGALLGAIVTSCILVGIIFGTNIGDGITGQGDEVYDKIELLDKMIEENYLYGEDVDEEDLKEGIYKGYLAGLNDPYSAYYNKEEYKALLESTSGHFYGIGAVFFKDEESEEITVKRTYDDAPADKSGVEAGDILKKVNGKSIDGKSLEEIVKGIQGDKGTTVELTLERSGKEYTVKIERDEISVDTVDGEIIEGNLGYITISEFTSDTYTQFDETLKELETKGMKGLIIDVRNNPGGVVDTTCKVLDELLPEGKIVYTKNKKGKISEINSDEEKKFEKPMVVLINGNSASASEIFAGAIQDYGLGDIIGETSYGKGVVQQLFPLSDGSGIKLTVSEYFTPKDQRINGTGVKPDITVVDDRTNDDKAEDNQLKRAIKELKKKI